MGEFPAVALADLELRRGCVLALLVPSSSLLCAAPGPARRAATRTVLHSILGKLTNQAPESLRFGKTQQGKPYLEGADPIRFNVSHSKSHSLVALSRSGSVGCDIEDRFSEDDGSQLNPLVLHAEETQAMNLLRADARQDAFRRYWVRKEAVLKALGSGFLEDPRQLIVSLDGPRARWAGREVLPFTLHERRIQAGCVAAVASMEPACSWHCLVS